MNQNLSRSQFRMVATGMNGESLAFGPGADPEGYKDFDNIGDALRFARSTTKAHPYDEHNNEYSADPVPVGEYLLHEGRLGHRIEPGTGRAIEENIRLR